MSSPLGDASAFDPSAPLEPVGRRRAGLSAATVGRILVLRPQGVFDVPGAASLHESLCRDLPERTVIDFSDCTLVDPSVLVELDPRRWGRSAAQICVACRRPTARQLLKHTGVSDRLTVFNSVEDALQANAFADAGIGPGWQRT
jgi:anti-anti-sigma regulatory factor